MLRAQVGSALSADLKSGVRAPDLTRPAVNPMLPA